MVKRVQVHVQRESPATGPATGPGTVAVPVEVALVLEAPDGSEKSLFVAQSERALNNSWHVCRESLYSEGLLEALEPKLERLTTVTAIGRVWASHWASVWKEPVEMAVWRHETTVPGKEG